MKAILIVGYDNARMADLRNLRDLATQFLKARIVFCKPNPTDNDKKWADYVIDTGLLDIDRETAKITAELNMLNLNIIGILSFSDAGNFLAEALRVRLNLQPLHLLKIRPNCIELGDIETVRKTVGNYISSSPKNQSGYLGYVIAESTDYQSLTEYLEKMSKRLSRRLIVSKVHLRYRDIVGLIG